ncbi:MAG: fatty acid desaturase [Pseudomonadota bacterium]
MLQLPAGGRRPLLREWPTWVALGVCYSLWCLITASHAAIGLVWVVPAAVLVAFHSSLQHEALHGHPTPSRALNEALVFPALGLILPYRRYRETHIHHHADSRLTDPYDDPETWYVAEGDLADASRPMRWILEANRTLAGRMLVGPVLGIVGFYRSDLRRMLSGDRRVLGHWLLHLPAMAPVLAWLWWVGVPLWLYLLLVVWPAQSLLAIRTFIEHKAEPEPAHRSVIVEAELPFRLLFLNNSLHALHHARPSLPWHELPAEYAERRGEILAGNGAYLVPGYGAVFRDYFLRAREPVAHPFLRKDGTAPGE